MYVYYNIIIDDKIIGSVCIKDLENAKLLDEIYLEKEFRNKGIGTDIIRKIIKMYIYGCIRKIKKQYYCIKD